MNNEEIGIGSRDIKFRVWDAKKEKMVYNFDFIMLQSLDEEDKVPMAGDFNWDGFNLIKGKVMQYTGLKDKNGKEIYEGDVVSYLQNFDTSKCLSEDPKATGTVKYVNEYACFDIEGWFGGLSLSKHIKQVEIIGNIFENKGLSNEL